MTNDQRKPVTRDEALRAAARIYVEAKIRIEAERLSGIRRS